MIRKALFLLPVLALAASAHAQFSLYGEVTVDKISSINSSPLLQTLTPGPCPAGTPTSSTCTAYNDSVSPIGFTGGGSYEFKTFGPATLSADIRTILESGKRGAQTASDGSGTRSYSGLGGIKATFNTPFKLFAPYVQGSVGYARSNFGVLNNTSIVSTSTKFPGIPTQNALEYHVFAGLDLRVLPVADWRVFEVGYGALESFGSYAHSYPLYTISTGVVFHIPPRY